MSDPIAAASTTRGDDTPRAAAIQNTGDEVGTEVMI
jgi:hypothetical protein